MQRVSTPMFAIMMLTLTAPLWFILRSQAAMHPPILPTETVNGQVAERLDGNLIVTHDGTAAYHIPLDVPGGRAGMAPRLSLAYDSEMNNGPLGVGWRLSGLSTI
jgi:Salmonella virulence plasmid 65kDa B protein